ncbi:1-acyl-sn-glycerol-3-phosphate acyltransferase [Candidatus Terasakiella magnetica]|nr:1-acyl-sn-glycerol-3-phosphate acyltransferase [Candidatus Terasakiella magnetica]
MLKILDRIWRAFGNGLFLTLIGVGGSLLALTVFPLIALTIRDPERRSCRIQGVIHHSFRLYCRAIHWMRIADVVMEGRERLKDLGGVLIVANHPSLLDVVMIMSMVPKVQCVVKAGLWRNPFFRLTVEGAGYIRNDLAPEALMAACVGSLRAGKNLIVFPEGTRTVAGRPLKFQRGFANIATLAEADVQLIHISCAPPILHKGNPWWRVPPTRTRFHLRVGERLDIRPFMSYRFRSVAARKLVERLEHLYSDELAHGRSGVTIEAADHLGPEAGRSVA